MNRLLRQEMMVWPPGEIDALLENDGLGRCNTGARPRVVCAVGGIGCDVDHLAIARDRIRKLELQQESVDAELLLRAERAEALVRILEEAAKAEAWATSGVGFPE